MLRCPKRRHIKDKMVKELKNYFRRTCARTCTRPHLGDLLREVIEQWFQTEVVVVRSSGRLYGQAPRWGVRQR